MRNRKLHMFFIDCGRMAILLLLVLLSFGACTRTETVYDELNPSDAVDIPIFFDTSADGLADSRALIFPDNFDISGNRISVYDVLTTEDGQHDLYMNGALAECDGISWSYSPLRYWTTTGVHSFTAVLERYYNGNDFIEVPNYSFTYSYDKDADLLEEETITVKDWTITTDNQFDFMYAGYSRSMDDQNPYSPVPLHMSHLLCSVRFNLTNLMPDGEAVYGGLTITGLYNNGTAEIRRTAESGQLVPELTLKQSGSSLKAGIPFGMTDGILENGKEYNLLSGVGNIDSDGYLLMWPHSAEQLSNVELTLELSGSISSKSMKLNVDASHWTAGNRYVYNINIQDNRIYCRVEVVDWIYDDIIIEE